MTTTEEKIVSIIESYEPRLKTVLNVVGIELERFSWHCSKIFKQGTGAYALAVSRDPEHLTRNGGPDDFDFEVSADSFSYTLDSKPDDFGITFKLAVVSFSGETIITSLLYQFINDSRFSAYEAKDRAMTEDEIEQEMMILEKFDPYQIVTAIQKWQKGKLPK